MSTMNHSGHRGTGTHDVPFGHFVSPMSHMGEAVYTAFAETSGLVGRIARAVQMKLRERATIQALTNLDEHQLADIGISCSEICYLARRLAKDPGFDHRSAT